MQYVEFFAVRADTGAALPSPTVTVYQAGTSTPAGVFDQGGAAMPNPFTGSAEGLVAFAAADGVYDVEAQSGAYTAPRITGMQVVDLAALAAGVSINVAAFGAACDGVKDDTDALQAAIASVGAAVNSSNAQGGGVVKIPRGGILRITRPVYLNPFVVIEGELGSGGFFQNFTPGQVTGSGVFADFDFTSGGAIEAVGFVSAGGARISPTTYVRGADLDAGTYSHHTGCGLRNLFVYTARANAFCPIRFVGAPQFVRDNVTVQGFWHGPIVNASWAGRIPSLFSRCLYSGLILDQDSNGCQLGALYLSGDLAGDTATAVPPASAFPNWPTYGLSDPNSQPPNANLSRTGLCVLAGDPVSADVLILEGWNVAVNVFEAGLSAKVVEVENISDHVLSVYGSRVQVDNLFASVPGKNLVYGGVGADVRLGVPEWVAGFFASPVQYWSQYANTYVIEGVRSAGYPYAGGVVTWRDAEDSPYNDLYIDAAAGDDAVIGCAAAAPLLTLNQALTRLRPDKLNRIFLQQGQTHTTGAATVIETLTATDCRIELHGYTGPSGVVTRPVLLAPPDSGNVHTNGLILTRLSLLFQDVDFTVRMCTGTPEGYNAGLYVQGACDVRFAGASTVQIESGATPVGLFQPWFGRPGALTWSLEDAASIAQYPGGASAGFLGVSAYDATGLLSVRQGVNSTAAPPIDPAIAANGYSGGSYAALYSPFNDIFVNAAAGSDANGGHGQDQPLKTLQAVIQTRLRADALNRIFLCCGQTHSTAGVASLPELQVQDCRVELHGYGPGANPVLEAAADPSGTLVNGLWLTRSSLLFQDVDLHARAFSGAAGGYSASLYIEGPCHVRFAGACAVQIEGSAAVALFQPWYGRAGALMWSLEGTSAISRYNGSAAGALGISDYNATGRLSVMASVSSTAATPIDAAIKANGYWGASFSPVNAN